MKILIYFIILIFSNASNINYINETLWNQISKKIDFNGVNVNQFKLCYFLNINCKYKDPR